MLVYVEERGYADATQAIYCCDWSFGWMRIDPGGCAEPAARCSSDPDDASNAGNALDAGCCFTSCDARLA
jgi:hypothetical protein